MTLPDSNSLPRQQQVAILLIQALDALREGLRPFVLGVLQEKDGADWFAQPRIQRMVSVPPSHEGEAPYGPEGPVLDLALLLKLIGSDSYWYRTFRPRLPGISHWQIDSLRELRNRVAHNDGEDPILTTASLALPYLNTMEQLLQVVGSDQSLVIRQIRARLQRSRRQVVVDLFLGRNRWSVWFWLLLLSCLAGGYWLVEYMRAPRLNRSFLVIGTPDRRLQRYLPLEQFMEASLRPAQFWDAVKGKKIDVRMEGARSYPEAVANLRAGRWDVLLGFSPVVSLEAVKSGYRPIGRMFPDETEYRSILFTRKGSSLRQLNDITLATRIALGDFYSATKYYMPMSLLQGRSARILVNLSTAEIAEQVRRGVADIGAMAGNPSAFVKRNPGFQILATSLPLPGSIVALSPQLSDLDRDRIRQALFSAPFSVRGPGAANYGTGSIADYRLFARRVAEGKVFSACLAYGEGLLQLRCPPHDEIAAVEGWIDDARPETDRIRLTIATPDHRVVSLLAERALLDQVAVFEVLHDLRGRAVRVHALRSSWQRQPLVVSTPHQLEIDP